MVTNMRRAMLQCNNVQTQVIAAGRWIEEDPDPNSSKHVVLVIPGNPGISEFYEGFIMSVSSRLPLETPVWVVGHAGHVQPPEELKIAVPDNTEWHKYYGLAGQLQHKVEFIRKYVPDDAKIHLIGHSIGSWFVLNLLKKENISERVVKCYLLFPTIEYMADSPNGKYCRQILLRLTNFLVFLSWIFTCLPHCFQVFLIRVFGIFYGIPVKSINAILQLINPAVMKRVLRLAHEELQQVKELDHEIISKYADKLWLYYGATDAWTPGSYYERFKLCHPNVEAQICKRGFHHSFVLNNDKEMGNIIGDMINESIAKS